MSEEVVVVRDEGLPANSAVKHQQLLLGITLVHIRLATRTLTKCRVHVSIILIRRRRNEESLLGATLLASTEHVAEVLLLDSGGDRVNAEGIRMEHLILRSVRLLRVGRLKAFRNCETLEHGQYKFLNIC